MNKKNIAIVILIMIFVSGLAYATSKNFDARELGKITKENLAKEYSEKEAILCYVNDIEISAKQFNAFKKTSLYYNKDIDEETLLENYIKFKLLVNEAEKEGFTITEQENENYTNELFKALENDEENMKIIKEYIAGMDINMKEYKEMVKEMNYRILLTMKLHEKLESEFLKKNEKTMHDSEELSLELQNYWENYKNELYNNAKIVVN